MAQPTELKNSAQRVQDTLTGLGLSTVVREMPATTRTAEDAASAIGCSVAQIVKSMVFSGAESSEPYLILVSGPNRVNEARLAELTGGKIQRAKPDFVREKTGFAIGGIPPLGHLKPLKTWMDEALLVFDVVWAAAGTPESVFSISPIELARVTGATMIHLQ